MIGVAFVILAVCIGVETAEQLLYRMAGRCPGRWWLFSSSAIGLHLIGLAFWYTLLKFMPLGVALPLSGISYAVIALAGRLLFGERITAQRWVGVGCIIAGFVLISFHEAQ